MPNTRKGRYLGAFDLPSQVEIGWVQPSGKVSLKVGLDSLGDIQSSGTVEIRILPEGIAEVSFKPD